MTLTKHALVEETQNCNITPKRGRRTIKIQEGLLLGDIQFSEKTALYLINLIEKTCRSMKVITAVWFEQSQT